MAMPKRNKRVVGSGTEHTLDQSFRLKKIVPMTDTQSDVFDAYFENFNLFLYGCAGTGKTYISMYLALKEVLNPNSPYRNVYIIRSSVPSRDMGFMPGKLQEKMAVYEAPYIHMLNDMFGRGDAYQVSTQKGVFEMISTSFLRGLTFENCIVIADEIQNCSFQELDTLITRIGNNTRLILCGDIEQCDLVKSKYDTTGLPHFHRIIDGMPSFEFIEFQPEDIVRSGFVKEYILQKRKIESSSDDSLAAA
jgi:phosphate starvation-inducible protein PhoH and related proteins